MPGISAELLALTSEAALWVKRGRVSFANSAACSIFGSDCVGKPIRSLLGAEIVCTQASSFIGDVPVNGRHYVARVSRLEGEEAIFLTRSELPPDLLSDAFFCSVRSSLMSLGVSVEAGRARAEQIKDRELLSSLASVNQSYYRLYRVVSNASVIRSLCDGSLGLNAMQFDLTQTIQRLTETLGLILDGPELCLGSTAPVMITADPMLIEQLLMNLISNCCVHAHGCTKVSFNLMESGDKVLISVSDDGCGIAQDELYAVFDRFRHSFDISSLGGGAGLGLTVVRGIAQLHGGVLLLESRKGKGATVRVSINKLSVPSACLRSQSAAGRSNMPAILIGLADCLPLSCFTEGFSD